MSEDLFLKKFSRNELREQEQRIRQILESGSSEELELLEKAEYDHELHPEIRALIKRIRMEHSQGLKFYRYRGL